MTSDAAVPRTEAGRRLYEARFEFERGHHRKADRNGLHLWGCYRQRDVSELLTTDAICAVEEEAAAGLDEAYRERNAVVAALIRTNEWPTWIVPAPDATGWWIVYAETPNGQVSWHVGAADLDLFPDWNTVAAATWDGHTTEEKYLRLADPARPETAEPA